MYSGRERTICGKSKPLSGSKRPQTGIKRSDSSYGSGFRSTPFTTVKIAVLAPIPRASVKTTMAVSAQLGRTFTDDEGRPGGEPVVILSHDFWQARFGGDPATIGSSVDINGTSRTIIGIMPEGFGFPRPNVQLYAPFVMDPANPGGRSAHGTSSIARQGDGQTLAAAAAEMDTLMAAWKAAWPDIHTGHYLFLRPLLEDMVGNARPMLLTLLGASGFVLLIVCANVAAIVLARGEDRSREIALRTALGASRGRLIQLVLGESLVLSSVGGLLGLAGAFIGVRALISLDAGSIPRGTSVAIELPVLLFAFGVTLATTVLFSLAPALHAASIEPRKNLVESGTRTSAGAGRLLCSSRAGGRRGRVELRARVRRRPDDSQLRRASGRRSRLPDGQHLDRRGVATGE